MKKFLLPVIALFLLASCSTPDNVEEIFDGANEMIQSSGDEEPELSIKTKILGQLNGGAKPAEVDNPGFDLPSDIHSSQIEKYFRLGDVHLALVMQQSMNVRLNLPQDFDVLFVGILVGNEESHWQKYLEIKDLTPSGKNNPYYLWAGDGKLFLSIVNQNGAGSGEGIQKNYSFDSQKIWNLSGCYYFGARYDSPDISGDYFRFSSASAEQDRQPKSSCTDVGIVDVTSSE